MRARRFSTHRALIALALVGGAFFAVESHGATPAEATSYTYVKVAHANAPETKKSGLVSNRLTRANKLINLYNEKNVHIGGQVESGTFLYRATESRNSWNFTQKGYFGTNWARYWDWRTSTGLVRGQDQVWNKNKYKLVHRHDFRVKCDIDCPHGSGVQGAGWWTFPVRLYEKRANGARFAVVAVHLPTRTMDPDNSTRNLMNRTVRKIIDGLRGNGIPAIIAADANDGSWASKIRNGTNRAKKAANWKPDWILVTPNIQVGCSQTYDLKGRGISDHQGIAACLRVPIKRNVWLPWPGGGRTWVS